MIRRLGLQVRLGVEAVETRSTLVCDEVRATRGGITQRMPPLRPSWRLQTGALIAAVMTIENYIAFLERVPILRRLGAGALRILGVNAVGSAAVAASINAAMKGLCWNRHAPKGR